MPKRSRSRLWIDRQIQGALAMRVMLHWCVFAFVACFVTLIFQFIADPFQPFSAKLQNIWRNQGPFLLTIILLLPAFAYDTIKLSHRFAGPILRLRKSLRAIAQGEEIQRVQFRDNDFWRGLAEDFNTLIDRGYFSQPTPASEPEPTTAEAIEENIAEVEAELEQLRSTS